MTTARRYPPANVRPLKIRPCIDCEREGITSKRKIAMQNGKPVPGPRCVTHHRAKKRERKTGSWEARLKAIYGITPEEYWEIYEYQGGACYICQRATGVRKRLSVDHCHETGRIRGLLCTGCNRNVLGHLRDCVMALARAIIYLLYPPAVDVIGERIAPIFQADDLTENGD